MRLLTTLLVTLLVLFAAERAARAETWAIVPAAAPSPAHPKGTVIVVGAQAAERDVASGQTLRKGPDLFKLRSSNIASVVAGGETFVATDAGEKGDTTGEVALWIMGSDLQPRERIAIGKGEQPTLVAGGNYLALGFYEWHAPTKTFKDWAPQDLYRVVVIDRASRQVLTQKVYGEPANLLCPRLFVESHMLAIAGGRLFVSLPLPKKAHIVAASLPTLATLAETDLAHDEIMGSMPIAWYGDRLVAVGPKWIELSSDLAVLAERPWANDLEPHHIAIDGTAVLVAGALPTGVKSARRTKAQSIIMHVAWAWGTPLAIASTGDSELSGDPTQFVVVP